MYYVYTNGSNNFLFVNATKVYQFKAKNSEIKDYSLCLGDVSKDLTISNMKKTGLTGVVNFNPFDNNILDIHKYLMKRTWSKIMFGLIKRIFIGLLSSRVNASNHTKCVSLSNQKCEIQTTVINLHLNEYSQEFHYYPFSVQLARCFGSCNCIPNKTEDLNLSIFNMITGINQSKTLTKHLS